MGPFNILLCRMADDFTCQLEKPNWERVCKYKKKSVNGPRRNKLFVVSYTNSLGVYKMILVSQI